MLSVVLVPAQTYDLNLLNFCGRKVILEATDKHRTESKPNATRTVCR